MKLKGMLVIAAALILASPLVAQVVAPVTVNFAAGDDGWTTFNDGGTYLRFDLNPLPAGFFGAGSNAMASKVTLFGQPIANSGGLGAGIDTIVRRMAPTGNLSVGSCASVPIDFQALHLESNPFTVTYSGGSSETWKIVAGLSLTSAQPIGSMTICRTCGNGGTFDANLRAYFLLRYVRVSPAPAIQFTQDCGAGDCPEATFNATGADWTVKSALGGMNLGALPANVQVDVDADGNPDSATTIGSNSFTGGMKICGTSGSGGGGGGTPECTVPSHVGGGGPKTKSSHKNYTGGVDSDGDGVADHCYCEDANCDGIDDDGGGAPCPPCPDDRVPWEDLEPHDYDGDQRPTFNGRH
ncbi:MAG: hypothetical protein AAF481_17045 [Acidobacteriota bacterium]